MKWPHEVRQQQGESQRKRAKRKGGGMESTVLISFQKHALINFFARDRLVRVLGRRIQETAAVENGEEKKITTNASPCLACIYILFYNISSSPLINQKQLHDACEGAAE